MKQSVLCLNEHTAKYFNMNSHIRSSSPSVSIRYYRNVQVKCLWDCFFFFFKARRLARWVKERKSSIFTVQSCVMNVKYTFVCDCFRLSLYFGFASERVSEVSNWVNGYIVCDMVLPSILLTCFTFVRTLWGLKHVNFTREKKRRWAQTATLKEWKKEIFK